MRSYARPMDPKQTRTEQYTRICKNIYIYIYGNHIYMRVYVFTYIYTNQIGPQDEPKMVGRRA